MVDPIGVVEVEVGVELAPQSGEADVGVAGERRPPALVEDRAMKRLDVAVRLWPAGVDMSSTRSKPLELLAEDAALELPAVVAEDALEPPTRA